ncbi:MAG: NAD(P)H-hydrate dehydratase [Acidobacteriota bacterium]
MIPVVNARQMRAADAAAMRAGIPALELMENAASALVTEIGARFPDWRRVVVVCGPGNNGGDGLAAGRLLAAGGVSATLFTMNPPAEYRGPAARNCVLAEEAGLEIASLVSRGGWNRLRESLQHCDGVLDALFGTGLSRAPRGRAARVIAEVARAGRPVLSADVPSGLSSDSGEPPGKSIQAVSTVAFGAPKFCHVLPPARGRCGHVVVRDIGIPEAALERQKSRVRIVEHRDVARLLPARPPGSNKADFGRLAIIAGSRGKAGAAILAARGALRSGAGLVTIFCPDSIESVAVSGVPESMTRALPERDGTLGPEAAEVLLAALAGFDAAVVGPGLSESEGVRAVLSALLGTRLPLVCDADALNAFSGRPEAFSRRRAATVLTPHPGEAGRLLSRTARQVQGDRLGAVTLLAKESRSIVVLKGEGTLTANPAGRVTVNPTGNPLLSAPGSGDVLAGAVGALLAAGLDAEDAAIAAVYLHGAAGDLLAETFGDSGMLAGELADALPATRLALRTAAPREGR